MRTMSRKTAPKVRDGRVQKKNNHSLTDTDFVMKEKISGPGWSFAFFEDYPGAGYRHCVNREDLERFFALVPQVQNFAEGLCSVVLGPGHPVWVGTYYRSYRCIELHAWERDLSILMMPEHYEIPERREFLADIFNLSKRYLDEDVLSVQESETSVSAYAEIPEQSPDTLAILREGEYVYEGKLSLQEAKVWVLLDVFLHELGHHVDCMSTKRKLFCPGKESYAERFALEMGKKIYKKVFREFRV